MPVLRFMKAAGRIGGGSVALSIILFLISIYEHLVDKNISAYWLVLTAGIFSFFGAYGTWKSTDQELTSQVNINALPLLDIELVRAFYDVSKAANKNVPQIHIYLYMKVTNTNPPETIVKDANLAMTIGGRRYFGVGDEVTRTGDTLEHFTDFRLGGEWKTEIFENIRLKFPRLIPSDSPQEPLRRGITQSGFLTFLFADLADWSTENSYIEANDIVLELRDSFSKKHFAKAEYLHISQGALMKSGKLPFAGVL